MMLQHALEEVLVGLCEHTHFHDKSLLALHSQTRTALVSSVPGEVGRLYPGRRMGKAHMPAAQ